MPEAIITLPDGRRARLTGPDRDSIMGQARRLASGAAMNPAEQVAREAQSAGLPLMDEERAALGVKDSPARSGYPMSLGPFGSVNLGGMAADAANAINNSGEAATPIVLGTMGSLAAGPVMTANAARLAVAPAVSKIPSLLGRLAVGGTAATAARFGPATLGAATGGGVGGGLVESQDPNATAGSIAQAASKSAREMATAELLGLGIGATASAVVAPMSTSILGRAAPFFDKIKDVREAAKSWIARAPSETRVVARELSERYPDEAAAAKAAAERLRELLASAGDNASTQKLRGMWDDLSAPARRAVGGFDKFSEGLRQVARVANSEGGRELIESAAVPLAAAAFGPGAAAVIWGIRQVAAPGPLARWFQNSRLPSTAVQTLGGQSVKTAARMETGGSF
jgi:hypothetical protein